MSNKKDFKLGPMVEPEGDGWTKLQRAIRRSEHKPIVASKWIFVGVLATFICAIFIGKPLFSSQASFEELVKSSDSPTLVRLGFAEQQNINELLVLPSE